MSQPPTPFERTFSFTGWSIAHPGEPHQGDKIDSQVDGLAASLSETIDRLNEIQQDDGFIRATALSAGLQALVDASAEAAATAVYATNLAQLSDKSLARDNLQLPQHFALLDGSNCSGWGELPAGTLDALWPFESFFPQANQNLSSINKRAVLGTYSSRTFRASVMLGSLKDYATWTGFDEVPSVLPRVDDISAAIGNAGVPNTVWSGRSQYGFVDYSDVNNLPNVANPLVTFANISDAFISHGTNLPGTFFMGHHVAYSFADGVLTLQINGETFELAATKTG